MTTTLILGATGRIASLITERLSKQPAMRLRLASSRDEGAERLRLANPKAEVVKADWYDLPSLKAAFAGVHRVLVIPPDFSTDESVASANIIAAARETPTLEIIVRLIAMKPGLAPEAMDDDWKNTRAGSGLHPIAKALLDASGLPVCYLNVCAWFGSNLSWMLTDGIQQHRQVRLPHDAQRAWLDDADIADAFATVLSEGPAQHVGREHVLTSRERYGFADLATLIGAEIGASVTYCDTEDALRQGLGDAGAMVVEYMKHEKAGWGDSLDRNDIERLIGRPERSLAEIVRAQRELFV